MGSGSSAQNTVKGTNQAMSPSKGVRFHPEVGSDSRGTVMYPAQRSTALKSFSYDDIDHMIAENRQRRIVVIKRKVYDLTSCMESLKASPKHETTCPFSDFTCCLKMVYMCTEWLWGWRRMPAVYGYSMCMVSCIS